VLLYVGPIIRSFLACDWRVSKREITSEPDGVGDCLPARQRIAKARILAHIRYELGATRLGCRRSPGNRGADAPSKQEVAFSMDIQNGSPVHGSNKILTESLCGNNVVDCWNPVG
jgi:hypothetical protein